MKLCSQTIFESSTRRRSQSPPSFHSVNALLAINNNPADEHPPSPEPGMRRKVPTSRLLAEKENQSDLLEVAAKTLYGGLRFLPECENLGTLLRREQEVAFGKGPDLKPECTLESKELWEKFSELGTEMIITKTGRLVFHLI